jgi:hypothetical protein
MPAGLNSSPWLPCRKRQGCFCGHVPKRTRHQRAPAKHEAYQCSNLDLPPKRVPVPTPHCGTFGTPTGCFPSAIRKTLVRRLRWSAAIHARQPKNGGFAHNCFYTSSVGRKRPDRADRMPPRAREVIRGDRIGGAPSKTKICEV